VSAPVGSRRTKQAVMLVAAIVALVVMVAWTQVWFVVTTTEQVVLEVDGQVAAGALSALALTSLVLIGALSIAGPFFRVVFGVLEALIGVAVTFSSVLAVGSPVAASAPAISEATGIAGAESVDALVASVDQTPWPWVALLGGVLTILVGIAILVTARRWPGSTRKYEATRLEPVASDPAQPGSRSSVDDWDALSGGDDPTSRS
jgi:hypothetical protein